MTTIEINKFRKVLEAKVVELGKATRQREGIVIEITADAFDRVLRANERDVAARNLEVQSARLRDARAALRRIGQGTYGKCVECDEPISKARLEAMPSASLCIVCQELRDCDCGARSARPVFAKAA